ncbi:uncharacterized protein [Narcine bancroftii]|uniref:uncharacterized protein n=1 Tax=Narcine bancroftii TaxID=1343680 RepID=UPI003831E9A1
MLFLLFIVLFNCSLPNSGTSLKYSKCIKSSWNRGSTDGQYFTLECRRGIDIGYDHSKVEVNIDFKCGPGEQNTSQYDDFNGIVDSTDINKISFKHLAQSRCGHKSRQDNCQDCTCGRERVDTYANVRRQATTHRLSDKKHPSPTCGILKHPLGYAAIPNVKYHHCKGSSNGQRSKQLENTKAAGHLNRLFRLQAALEIIAERTAMALNVGAEERRQLLATIQQNRLALYCSLAAGGSVCARFSTDNAYNGQAVKDTGSGLRQKYSHAHVQTWQPWTDVGWTRLFTENWSLILTALIAAGLTILVSVVLPYLKAGIHFMILRTPISIAQGVCVSQMDAYDTAIRLLTRWEKDQL